MQKQQWTLSPESEFRFEVNAGSLMKLKLIEGTAEITGNIKVLKLCMSSAVFTWTGCEISTEGNFEAYTATETCMNAYLNVHHLLQKMRDSAREDLGKHGPRVMLVAPVDFGKSTICKILVNYAARQEERVTFVDLDVGQNAITIPGTISAIVKEVPEISFGDWSQNFPIAYYYGSATPSDNPKLYKTQIKLLYDILQVKDDLDSKSKAGGWIINTCGWVDGLGLQLLYNTIECFAPDVVLVVSYDKLYNKISNFLKNNPKLSTTLTKIPKSDGVVLRDSNWRKASRDAKLKEYFYGCGHQFNPRNQAFSGANFTIFKLGLKPVAPASVMPIGHQAQEETLKLIPSTPVQNFILAISHAKQEDQVLTSPVSGFLRVIEYNQEKNLMKCLLPQPLKLANPSDMLFLISGNIKFMDQ